jgi:monoamine oxidase
MKISKTQMSFEADVIVVGAGISGLSAANTLIAEGYQVIVVEAQNRYGGRLKTDKTSIPGQTIDLGASWIHGHKGNPMTDFVNLLDLDYFVTDYENSEYFDVGVLMSESTLDSVWKKYNKVAGMIASMQENENQDMPLSEALDIVYNKLGYTLSEQREVNFAYIDEVETEYAASCENLTMWWYDSDSALSGSDWWLPGGYGQIPDYLSSSLDIRYNEAVNAIDYTDSSISITTTSGHTYTSPQAIVTVPLGILQRGNISFTPALPSDIQHGIDHLYMAVLEKTFIQFDEVFWSEDRDFVYTLSNGTSRYQLSIVLEHFNIEYYLPGSKMLCVFGSGLSAWDLEKESEAQRLNRIMSALRTVWPTAPDPIAYHMTSWGRDPFTYGSYSALGLGSSPMDRVAFQQAIDDKIYFAGEHTSTCFPSTAHGAYYSGEYAARLLMGLSTHAYCSRGGGSGWITLGWIIGFAFMGCCVLCSIVAVSYYCNTKKAAARSGNSNSQNRLVG